LERGILECAERVSEACPVLYGDTICVIVDTKLLGTLTVLRRRV
jgi:hypothetical protein